MAIGTGEGLARSSVLASTTCNETRRCRITGLQFMLLIAAVQTNLLVLTITFDMAIVTTCGHSFTKTRETTEEKEYLRSNKRTSRT